MCLAIKCLCSEWILIQVLSRIHFTLVGKYLLKNHINPTMYKLVSSEYIQRYPSPLSHKMKQFWWVNAKFRNIIWNILQMSFELLQNSTVPPFFELEHRLWEIVVSIVQITHTKNGFRNCIMFLSAAGEFLTYLCSFSFYK